VRSKGEASLSAVSISVPSPVPAIVDIGQQPAGHPLCSGECLGPADRPSSNCRASAQPSHRPGRDANPRCPGRDSLRRQWRQEGRGASQRTRFPWDDEYVPGPTPARGI